MVDSVTEGKEALVDFGGIVHLVPCAVVRPEDGAEVAAVLRAADVPVVPRGCAHSTCGQSQVDGGIVLDMRGLGKIHEVRADRVTVDAGATWREVLDVTLPRGLTPPVLTDYLDLTVGGTLAVGGLGGTSFRYGRQLDNVLELQVATPDGEIVTRPADDWRPGVITRATLRLVPAPERVWSYRTSYPSVADLLAARRRIGADHVSGQAEADPEWAYELTSVVYGAGPNPLRGEAEDLSYAEFADRMRPDVEELIRLGEWARPHPWAVVLLPGPTAAEIIETTLAETTPRELGLSGVVLITPLMADQVMFGLLRTASIGAASPEEMLAANRTLYERTRIAGGVRYPV